MIAPQLGQFIIYKSRLAKSVELICLVEAHSFCMVKVEYLKFVSDLSDACQKLAFIVKSANFSAC